MNKIKVVSVAAAIAISIAAITNINHKNNLIEEQSSQVNQLEGSLKERTLELQSTTEQLKNTNQQLNKTKKTLETKNNQLQNKNKQLEQFKQEVDSLKKQVSAKKEREAKARQARLAVAKSKPTVSLVPAATTTQNQPVASPTTYSGGSSYSWGQCTWYVARRAGAPEYLGNAYQWSGSLPSHGYRQVSATAGSIGVMYGGNHVVYAESVNSDGTVNISEMNYNGGVGVTNYRTVSAGSHAWFIR